MFGVVFDVVEIVGEMVPGRSLIVSPRTAALSPILHPDALTTAVTHDSRERNARRGCKESQFLCDLKRMSE
jgi:hypothetical protein